MYPFTLCTIDCTSTSDDLHQGLTSSVPRSQSPPSAKPRACNGCEVKVGMDLRRHHFGPVRQSLCILNVLHPPTAMSALRALRPALRSVRAAQVARVAVAARPVAMRAFSVSFPARGSGESEFRATSDVPLRRRGSSFPSTSARLSFFADIPPRRVVHRRCAIACNVAWSRRQTLEERDGSGRERHGTAFL